MKANCKSMVVAGGTLATAWLLLAAATTAQAVPLGPEYTINATVTPLGGDAYRFQYDITNNTQQVGSAQTGLDGFFVELPPSSSVSDVVVPAPFYGSPGYWAASLGSPFAYTVPEITPDPNTQWQKYWGANPASVYPIGSTASFSFVADNVTVGAARSVAVTYWAFETPLTPLYFTSTHGHYTGYSTMLLGPTEIPEPATLGLLAMGGLAMLRRRRRSRQERE